MEIAKIPTPLSSVTAAIWLFIKNVMEYRLFQKASGYVVNASLSVVTLQ